MFYGILFPQLFHESSYILFVKEFYELFLRRFYLYDNIYSCIILHIFIVHSTLVLE